MMHDKERYDETLVIEQVRQHLNTADKSGKAAAEGMKLLQDNGKTHREIGEAVGVSHTTVRRYLDALGTNGSSFQDALTGNRQGEKQRSVEYIVAETEKMDQTDRIAVSNGVQKQITRDAPKKPVKERNILDTVVSLVEVRDAIAALKLAEPGWTADVRAGRIGPDMAADQIDKIEMVLSLMHIAVEGEIKDPSELLA